MSRVRSTVAGSLLRRQHLHREEREFLIVRCNTSCRVTVQGDVGTVFFQPGIVVAKSLLR